MALRVSTQALTRNIRRSGGGVLKLNHNHVRKLQTFTLPDLPYDYHELEPVSAEIMELHHQNHHQTYITNFNRALEQLDHSMSKADSPAVVKLQSAIKFNGGGGEPPGGALGKAIHTQFGSLEWLIDKINLEGVALQGSGWVWLALDKEKELKRLFVETTVNQVQSATQFQ